MHVILPPSNTLFRIHHIDLTQFRNYSSSSFDFTERIITICGSNGIGKTNLLDAIYYLSFTKSYFSKTDAISIEKGETGFRIAGVFTHNNTSKEVSVVLRENGKKELSVDHEPIGRFSDHIGSIPILFVAPDDIKLITGTSEERRNFLDTLISQWDHDYLINLIKYNKTMQERNRFLKSISSPSYDIELLDSFDEQLCRYGSFIVEKRISFTHEIFPMIENVFSFLSDQQENPQLTYIQSTKVDSYLEQLKNSREKDIILQRTSIGVHKDDIEIEMNELPFKQIASQGQKKSMLFAMKLAAFELLKKHKGFDPVLLLDDIFEKLDEYRLKKLLEWVCVQHNGQVFMTDTHPERMNKLIEDISLPFQSVKL